MFSSNELACIKTHVFALIHISAQDLGYHPPHFGTLLPSRLQDVCLLVLPKGAIHNTMDSNS